MILVTGANGQLGRCFRQLAENHPQWTFLAEGSDTLNISDNTAVEAYFSENKPRWVVNCAAYTAVDKAESEPDKAELINVTGVEYLARACARHGAGLIHFSTDYVYNGNQGTAFRETDPVAPAGVYARTKLAGEKAALQLLPGAIIIRTSWVYAREGNNFVNTMLRLGRERGRVRVVSDQIGTPTYAPDLAAAVLEIISQVENGRKKPEEVAGTWNYSNEGVASWYDFAHAIFETAGIQAVAEPIESSEYPTPAKRPPFSVLNKSRIREQFGLHIAHWRDSLKACLLPEAHI
jgi:dTDP-4-dehydrorhamnose reductase